MTTIVVRPKKRSSSSKTRGPDLAFRTGAELEKLERSSARNPPSLVELERIARRAWETYWKAQADAARNPSDPKLRKAKAAALKIANAAEARAEQRDLELGPPAWGSPRDI